MLLGLSETLVYIIPTYYERKLSLYFLGGLALPIIFGTGQVITSICSKEISSDYEKNIDRIIASVDQKTGKFKQTARMVINKKKTYETSLKSFVNNGIDSNEAQFLAICGLMAEMTQEVFHLDWNGELRKFAILLFLEQPQFIYHWRW